MVEKIKGVVKGSAEFLGGATTAVVAFLLANLGCGVLVCMFILSALVALATVKSSRYSKRGKFVIIAVSAMILMSIGMYHKNNFHNVVKEEPALTAVEEETTEEKTEEETTVATEEVVEEEKFVRNYLDDSERKECIDIQVTKESSKNIETGKAEVEGTTKVSINEATTATNDDLIIDQAKEDDSKEVTEMAEGITAVTEKVTEEEKSEEAETVVEEVVEETTKPEKVEISEEVVEEITSEESKDDQEIITEDKVETLVEEETDKEEDFADMSDEELNDLFVETTTETVTVVETVVEVEDVVEDTKVEIETPVIEIEKTEEQEIVEDEVIVEDVIEIEEEATEEIEVEVEDIVKEEPVVEEVEVVEAVAVTAIDGYTTVVGSQIQFQVSGDDVVIEGLDGINYTFSNGILTIDAGSEATVISVCVSNSVNAVDFNITVNGIIG